MTAPTILIVDDEKLIRWSLAERLKKEGFGTVEAGDGVTALEHVKNLEGELVLLDLRLPDTDGIRLLKQIRAVNADLPVIMITAYGTVEVAVEAMKLGAYDYVAKPFNMDELVITVQRALEASTLRREVLDIRRSQKERFGIRNILGTSASLKEAVSLIERVGRSDATTILLLGESGTGKDLMARAIHYESRRAERPFMTITCTTIQETLLESELFGHEKGAFTDARNLKQGLFELASGGTVFLDEIGDMPLSLQAKLLRFLEDKAFKRLGGVVDIRVDVRVIAATHRDIEKMIREGRFREDLFYRLNIVPIRLPPLRERKEDVEALALHFVRHYSRELSRKVTGLAPRAVEALAAYNWPGNVRELRNSMERAVLLGSDDVVTLEDLPQEVRKGVAPPERKGRLYILPREGIVFDDVEKDLVLQALEFTDWNQTRSAELLGMSRDQIRYRIEKFALVAPGREGAAGGGAGGAATALGAVGREGPPAKNGASRDSSTRVGG
ncbi:MAG: sigma-54-dependent Fis family transcriptional regulator [Planctomycetes bacterium]|nr:sigma-54-dependent Fis family transcriptional regulator [Planctomycetota bacterium]